MKIGLISDTHDHCSNIDSFIDLFIREKIDRLIHLGDIVAPFAAKRFQRIAEQIPFQAIYGNNDGEKPGLHKTIAPWGKIEEGPVRVEAGGKVIVCHHYPMTVGEALALHPDADYYLSGHTHELVDRREGRLRSINPGEACGWVTGRATAAILEPEHDLYTLLELKK